MTAIAVYGLGTFVIVGVVPPEQLYGGPVSNLAPVASAAEIMAGPWGKGVMTAAAILAFLSAANAGILSASRYPLAMSRDHLLPRWFRHLSKQQTPRNEIVVTVALLLVFTLVFNPIRIAELAIAFLLMLFAINCLAVLVMREIRIESYDPGFRTPWHPWLQIAGIVGPTAFIALMGWLPILFSAGVIGLGAAWYFYYGRHRVVRKGAIYHLFARLGEHRSEQLDRELRGILKEKDLRADDPYEGVVAHAKVIDVKKKIGFEALVDEASELLAERLPLSAKQLATRFMEGTRVGATPVSKGVALPHVRIPTLERPLMVLCRTATGLHIQVKVNFVDQAADQLIHAVIFLVSPEDNAAQHLRILAQVARHVDADGFMEEWLEAESQPQLKEILLREDRFLCRASSAQLPNRTAHRSVSSASVPA